MLGDVILLKILFHPFFYGFTEFSAGAVIERYFLSVGHAD
jgi:hypothetical protein